MATGLGMVAKVPEAILRGEAGDMGRDRETILGHFKRDIATDLSVKRFLPYL
jgi:hypothetical protein